MFFTRLKASYGCAKINQTLCFFNTSNLEVMISCCSVQSEFLEFLHWTCTHSKCSLRFLYSWKDMYELWDNICHKILLEVIWSNVLFKVGQTSVAQGFIQWRNKYLQGWRFHYLTEQPITIFDYPHKAAVWDFFWYLT